MNKLLSSGQRIERAIFRNQYPQRNTSGSVATGLEFMEKTGRVEATLVRQLRLRHRERAGLGM